MVARINPKKIKQKLRKVEYLFLAVVCIVFLLVAGKYYYTHIRITTLKNIWGTINARLQSAGLHCAEKQIRISVTDGVLCRSAADTSVWTHIYDTSPVHPNGKELVYSFLDEGSLPVADQNLQNVFTVERSSPVKLYPLTWEEDPYHDEYWKFVFYSLRPTTDLLYAYRTTHDEAYRVKLLEILQSFLTMGTQKENAWEDSHAVAFRTMVLTNTWWKLREAHALPIDVSTQLLNALEQHGAYLSDPAHYEPDYNRGLNEAAALYVLAVSFPDMPHSQEWLATAKQRLATGLNTVVDSGGVLADNAPSYHFSLLEKAWSIYAYSVKFKEPLGNEYKDKLWAMISYAAYILQPDLRTPLLGASTSRKITYAGIYKEIADAQPEFKYVVTEGKYGTKPKEKYKTYTEAGQVVLRSDWKRGEEFEKQTQLIYDIGPYRTAHSDFDALNFSLYANGSVLIPDGGPYNADAGPYRNYFHGTASHNTVLVDGKSQNAGSATAGQYTEGDGYVVQTAEHSLYTGVHHQRAIALIGSKYVLVVDNLTSNIKHSYEQLFHLFPDAELSIDGLTVNARGKNSETKVSIHQLLGANMAVSTSKDQASPIRGLCSKTYDSYYPCYTVSYKQTAANAQFVTLLEIGEPDPDFKASATQSSVYITANGKNFTFALSETDFTPGSISVEKNEPDAPVITPAFTPGSSNGLVLSPTTGGVFAFTDGAMEINAPTNGDTVSVTKKVNVNLNNKNVYLRIKAENASEINRLSLDFSNNNFASYMQNNLRNSYRKEYEGEWIGISLGKGELRDSDGQWQLSGKTFDWSRVDGIRIRASANTGAEVKIIVAEIGFVQTQDKPAVAFIFDDGYDSIAPAVELMHQYGLRGNIAVIADRVDKNTAISGYLNLANLQKYQNDYGWNMINHSQHHVDAVESYYQPSDLNEFEEDMLNGAKFLIQNGLNSAPNWYVYPHGSTNGPVKSIVSKYYTFARTTQTQPESFPFGENYGIKTLSAGGSDSEGSFVALTPDNIIRAIEDAQKYNLTLLITFHRIHTTSSDRPGYEYEDFKKVIEYLVVQGIDTKTVSQLDALYGVKENTFTVTNEQPAQLQVAVTSTRTGILEKVTSYLKNFK